MSGKPHDHKGSSPKKEGKKPTTKSTATKTASSSGSHKVSGASKTPSPEIAAESSQSSNGASAYFNEEKSDTNNKEQNKPELDRCAICMDDCTEPKQLDKCGHTFCKDCIDHYFHVSKPQCPCCFTIYGDIRGNQPENGKMKHIVTKHRLPGYTHTSNGTIRISYYFPNGTQNEKHPHPGISYQGTQREAYLPDNREGRHVLKLLQRSFELRQTFTVGQSRTTGSDDCVTWNDIHHKTSYQGGIENFGYPDETYLNRVQQELAAKGIQ